MPTKAGRPLIELAKLCYDAGRPFLLVGRHGVGKSALLEQADVELGIGYICRDLSLMEPSDLIGLPKMDGPVTRYLPPAFLPADGRGLLVFEELNRCPAYMRAPCLQLLTARTLNDYMLPTGWLPVAAINPSGTGYEVEECDTGYDVEELDPALLSRFVQVAVVPDREEWLAWARASEIHPDVIAYVASDPAIFDGPESNPRAWAYVSDLLRAVKAGTPRETLREAVAGLVGPTRMAAFFRAPHDDSSPLTADDVLAYPHHRARLRAWIKAGRLDLAGVSLLAIQKRLQARRDYDQVRANDAAWKNLGTFLGDLPGDLYEQAIAFFKDRDYDSPRARKRA
jgi:MoxR-like ATPase